MKELFEILNLKQVSILKFISSEFTTYWFTRELFAEQFGSYDASEFEFFLHNGFIEAQGLTGADFTAFCLTMKAAYFINHELHKYPEIGSDEIKDEETETGEKKRDASGRFIKNA